MIELYVNCNNMIMKLMVVIFSLDKLCVQKL